MILGIAWAEMLEYREKENKNDKNENENWNENENEKECNSLKSNPNLQSWGLNKEFPDSNVMNAVHKCFYSFQQMNRMLSVLSVVYIYVFYI